MHKNVIISLKQAQITLIANYENNFYIVGCFYLHSFSMIFRMPLNFRINKKPRYTKEMLF